MPLDPAIPPALDLTQRLQQRIADLEFRLRAIEAYMQGGSVGQIPVVAALPAAGRIGRLLMLSTDQHVYKDTGAAWVDIG